MTKSKTLVMGSVAIALVLVAGIALFSLFSAAVHVPVPQQPPDDSGAPPPTNNTNPPDDDDDFSNPFGLGPKEAAFYKEYLDRFVRLNGAAISNAVPVPWCPNSCIGCDGDVTSEAVGRSLDYSADTKDKPIVDRYTRYYMLTMRHPGTEHMMWKLASDGSVASACNGQNSAVDGELEAIEGLEAAKKHWSTDGDGNSYSQIQRKIMDSLKDGVVSTPYGKTLPHCMYPTSNDPSTAKSLPCNGDTGTPMVYVGYLNLKSIKAMAAVDSSWNEVYLGSRELVKQSFRDGGIYTTYYTPAASTPAPTPTPPPEPVPAKIEGLALTCTGGSVTKDEVFGGCRTIVCGSKQVLACDKPDGSVNPEYFEMYKQSGAGSEEICLASTCIQDNGFAKGDYPSDGLFSIFSTADGTTTAGPEWATKEFFVHNMWVLKHACEDGLCTPGSAPRALYDLQKQRFYATTATEEFRLYEGFEPGKGGVLDVDNSGDLAVFTIAETLETAVALQDSQFVKDLIALVHSRCARNVHNDGPILCNPDNYGNIVVLQAFAGAREAGYTVG